MSINVEETILRFGYNPLEMPKRRQTKVVETCDICGSINEIGRRSFDNKKGGICRRCPENSNNRSAIAVRSNKARKTNSPNYLKYLPYLEDLKSGKTTFLEISKILGIDDSSVCKFFHSNFNIKSRFGNKSSQEDQVAVDLATIFPGIKRSVRYNSVKRHVADFFVPEIGYIEYDGAGFYHQLKPSDSQIDQEYQPIRLNAQAYCGGVDYLNWKFGKPLTGYCKVSSPREYTVREIRSSKANELLENCHSLGAAPGYINYGLFYKDLMIGVAKFGQTTNPYDSGLELRRFFILDGTPKNSESWFLSQCEKRLPKGRVVTYIHRHEKGSYLRALAWTEEISKIKDYDFYIINGKMYNKRKVWGWAKKTGLVEKFGTKDAKEVLVSVLGGVKVMVPSKIKFTKEIV